MCDESINSKSPSSKSWKNFKSIFSTFFLISSISLKFSSHGCSYGSIQICLKFSLLSDLFLVNALLIIFVDSPHPISITFFGFENLIKLYKNSASPDSNEPFKSLN